MKTNNSQVNKVFMSIVTTGFFAFTFTACSDDDFESPVNNNAADNAQVASNEDGIRKPYGLVYTDFINSNDVQILNADTTMISVSKVYADKMGITVSGRILRNWLTCAAPQHSVLRATGIS